jgi:hypothetical protein
MPTRPYDLPLDEALNHATHIEIVCQCPRAAGHCCHSSRMLTRELVELCPGAVSYREFTARLRCKACRTKGWALIKAVGR